MQQGPRFYILLESTCLFDAPCYEFRDRESYDGFFLPVERELIVKNLLFDLLIMELQELQEFVLFMELFVASKETP